MSAITSNPLASQSGAASNSGSSLPSSLSANSLSTEFLQLLIAQLKNQDPSNPTDGTAFVTQLATFTNVQQQTQSTNDLNSILSLMQAAAAPANGTPATTSNSTTSSNGTAKA